MNTNDSAPKTPADPARWLLIGWTICIAGIFLLSGALLASGIASNKRAADARHAARINPDVSDPDVTPGEPLPAGANPLRVTTGIYIERISALSIAESSWTVEFDVWFRWDGSDATLGERFEVIDGSIDSQSKQVERHDGTQHYVRHRVVSTITKSFDTGQYPCDDHQLLLGIELPGQARESALLVPDQDNSAVSSRVRIPGYAITQTKVLEKPHTYRSAMGDPGLRPNERLTQSQLRIGVAIARPGWGLYWKLFQSLYVAVGIALLAAFIKPTDLDPRFGLGVGAVFAAVANSYVTASLTPQSNVASLADAVNGVGTMTILLTLVQSTMSLAIEERQSESGLSRRFDRLSFWLFLVGIAAVNVAMVVAAC